MSTTIDPNYQQPPEDTVELDCETLAVSGNIRSPTITRLDQSISSHVNNHALHRNVFETTLTTDGVSDVYTVTHDLGTTALQVAFFDVTTLPQKSLFVNWEPVTNNAIQIKPDVRFAAGRVLKIILQ